MKIALASDHGGFLLKEEIKSFLLAKNHEVIDCGTYNQESCDYSAYALICAKKVANNECENGILVCTSGEGVMIAANKVNGIRCGLVYNLDTAHLIKEHNDCNMMSLGAKFINKEDALLYVETFLNAKFEEGRHTRRVDIIKDYEKNK